MAEHSKIEWTDASWTPIRARFIEIQDDGSGKERLGWHCEHASEACRFCYAEGMNRRLGTGLDFKPGHLWRADRVGRNNGEAKLYLDEKMLAAPLRWRKPRMIFVCSMTDLFASFVTEEWIDRVFAVMALCPRHTFQVLTKRAARMRAYISDPSTVRRVYEFVCDLVTVEQAADVVLIAPGVNPLFAPAGPKIFLDTWPLANVWLGTSVEDQACADERIPQLLATPAAVRFVSYEPALGSVDFSFAISPSASGEPGTKAGAGQTGLRARAPEDGEIGGIHWIIAGGESGPHARPAHPEWFRQVRDQCAASGVPFFFKQWGAWAPTDALDGLTPPDSGKRIEHRHMNWAGPCSPSESDYIVNRVGKKAAAALLDGREHREFPNV